MMLTMTITMMMTTGIDEMPKSEIEKRKRNMESISRISRREKRNVEICFLVREENENFCKKKSRNLQFSPISRREILKTNLMIRGEIETSRFQTFRDEKEKFTYHHSHSYFCFISSVLKMKNYLRHKEEF